MRKNSVIWLGLFLITAGSSALITLISIPLINRRLIAASTLFNVEQFAFPILVVAIISLGAILGLLASSKLLLRGKHLTISTFLVAVFSGTLIGTFAYSGFQYLIWQYPYVVAEKEFSAQLWEQAGCHQTRTRQQMLLDTKKKLVGLSRQEVEALIGPPDLGLHSYCLGPEPTLLPTDQLIARFIYDSNSRMIDIKVSAN